MKKNLISVLSLSALMFLGACSESNDPSDPDKREEKSSLSLRFDFAGTTSTKAGGSTAVPPTNWNSIKDLLFILYDDNKNIVYSAKPDLGDADKTYTYSDVPEGHYTLVAVANVNTPEASNAVVTQESGRTVVWDQWNIRDKMAGNLSILHKEGTFPAWCNAEMTAKTNKAFLQSSEVFMGYAENVNVSSQADATATVKLKREVSLMRVRLNVDNGGAGVDNKNTVDYTRNAAIMVFRLQEKMGILNGKDGGVLGTPAKTRVLAVHGNGTFKKVAPDAASGYTNPNTILSGGYTMWNDVVIWPNNKEADGQHKRDGQQHNADTAEVTSDYQYFVVISAMGLKNHVLANGTKLAADQTIYWSGLVKGKFMPNTIREVNLTLRTGGDTEVPTEPTEFGKLIVTVNELIPWDSNIVKTDLEL